MCVTFSFPAPGKRTVSGRPPQLHLQPKPLHDRFSYLYRTMRPSFAIVPCFLEMVPPQLSQTQNQVLGVAELSVYRLYLFDDYSSAVSLDLSSSTVIDDVLIVHKSHISELDEYEIISPLLRSPYMYLLVSVQFAPLYDRY